MTEYRQILKNILEAGRTWGDVKFELSKYNVHNTDEGEKDTRAGKIFEVLTQLYFRFAPTEKDNFKNVWLFEEVPSEIRTKLNLGNQDFGADLILEDIEGKLYVVQCKFKNDESSRLNWTSDKIANLFAFCPTADHFIVFSNAADLDKVSKSRHDNFTFYSVTNLQEIQTDVFKAFHESLIGAEIAERTFYNPKPHQEEAIKDCIDFFGIEQRGQLILPCGAGKTYTALWIKEGLDSKNSLVLVPSLALLRQIKNEWANQRKTIYQYLCVCSESDIDKDVTDSVVAHTYEIDTRVTTDPLKIKSFLDSDYTEKVIFSTYHSLEAIAEAIANIDFEFDFIFCDEAHKTAGVGMNKFSLVHDNKKIPSKRRLYATATPRIVKESLKKKLGDDLKYAYDMNDPETFGHEFYRMTFKDAIEQDILVDYKIVTVGVNSEELKEYIENRRFIDAKISIDELANNYALDHIMKKYSANHGLTFHSRVKLAAEFADRHSKLFPDTSTFAVSGEQPTSQRNITLNDFKNADKAIVSNARCLTEGVDVPTIDLVYFCDPKNSKVDIVQAVGRALRKKEGKKIGLVVVPIYHSKQTEVEVSISSGSFKNLLQVIRSLCDQDERLQDEINSLAYGKGRRSSRIDIVSGSFIEEQDTILLEGFEEILKTSLFDQIVDKTSNNWDLWFLKLKEFLDKNPEYPSQKTDRKLYQWVAQQRNRKKNGTLKNEEIRKLNSISFAWSIVEWKWNKQFEIFEEYAKSNEFPPCKGIDNDELVKWHKYQQTCIREGKIISDYQKNKFLSIDGKFAGPASRKKWIPTYNDLVNFRKENPDRWPLYNREDKDSRENGLYVFCQTIRKRYRENDLSDYWFEKMAEIDFNFGGKTDNWTNYFEEVKDLISDKDSISADQIGNNAYSWILRHKKNLDEGTLSEYQTKKIQTLNLDRFFEGWEERFEKISKWVEENGKIPTKHAHSEFNSWLYSQRSRYKKGTLTEDQITSLRALGFDLEGRGKERFEEKWLAQFMEYKDFVNQNNREPSYRTESEKQLYLWVAAQRAVNAGNARNRKSLSQKRLDLLNSINFKWVGEGAGGEESWEERFQDFCSHIKPNGKLMLPSRIDGKANPLYTWWINQNIAFDKGELSSDRIQQFQNVKIELGKSENNSVRDGFTKWSNKLHEIADFINKNGHYPRAGKDKEQSNLYQSLARTKRVFKNNELSEKQLELLKELNIELE
ncbi:DEAD/DEAH box helicase [Reichenbachiella sp. MSK19-1]|uniref:DEAD/DEAH box helicase n=1 Tax=Reichenbachiella sp. MSK19-1 TaxID=1897631 RepID=UPI000E6B9442|nr:DEAD/DEAH box helicase [Reichenbachiella sp. MSK19-1]RJE72587.1 hypothetical protein BGP76_01040 [Reichenbachiella sp. MSK19-1]